MWKQPNPLTHFLTTVCELRWLVESRFLVGFYYMRVARLRRCILMQNCMMAWPLCAAFAGSTLALPMTAPLLIGFVQSH